MRNGEYGLGIDVGDGAVSAAVCGMDGGAVALPLGEGRVTAAVGGDGRVELVPADGTTRPQHLVARVGDPVPVYAGGRAVPAAELVADVVQLVRALAAEREGRPDAWTVVTVPPSWAGHRCADLARALAGAGVPRFSLVSSAVAAVSAHVAAGDLPAGPTVAVYDLGAGTLDTAVVAPGPDRPLAHRAAPPAPLPWGGRDVDDTVVGHVVDCLGTPGGGAAVLRAACVAAKEALSTATVVQVDVGAAADGPVRLTREELDEVLVEPARRSAAVLAATVAAAGLRTEDLDAVVLSGGGVRVPLVAEVLSGELGRPLVVGDDPALTSALGAAALAAEALAAEFRPVEVAPAQPQGVAAAEQPQGLAAAEQPRPVLPRARSPRDGRDRTRPAPAPAAAASRPAPRRSGRLGRGAVVTGLALGLLLLGPAAAGLFDAALAPAPAETGAAAQADGEGVVARGSAAVGGGSTASREEGTAEGAAPGTAARSTGSPARTSLAAALATAARTGAPSVAGSTSARVPDGRTSGSRTSGSSALTGTALQSTPPRSTTPGSPTPGSTIPGSTAPVSSAGGNPTTSAPVQPTSSAPGTGTSSGPSPVTEQPPATPSGTGQPPAQETPAQQPPAEQPPAEQPPAEQQPTDPAPMAPAPEQPAEEQPPSESPSSPTGDPGSGADGSTTSTTSTTEPA